VRPGNHADAADPVVPCLRPRRDRPRLGWHAGSNAAKLRFSKSGWESLPVELRRHRSSAVVRPHRV